MKPNEWRRVQALVDAALQRDPEEREVFLDASCSGQPTLRSAVATLLRAQQDFLSGSIIETGEKQRSGGESASGPMVQRVGPYIIRQELGRGGMGVVYLADDTRLSRRVALKSLSRDIGRDSSARERLRREARVAAGLSHPGIATVYALEEISDDLYLACEYVPGPTLRSLLDKGPLPLPQVIDIALQLARALVTAHEQGIVHRDLKPENVVRTPTGVIKVLDFGVARVEGLSATRLTNTGTIIGTPAYMAPEQADGVEADFRSDLFALGVMVYEMASGSNPFEARTVRETILRILDLDPTALSGVCGPEFEPLDPVVSTLLHKDREARYRSTQQLVDELEELRGDAFSAREHSGRRRAQHVDVAPDRSPNANRRRWQIHQFVIIAFYLVAAARAWQIKTRMIDSLPLWIFVGIGVGAMISGTMRGHLLFTEMMNPDRLSEERRRTRGIILIVDLLLAAALAFDGLIVVPTKAIGGVVTIAVALFIMLTTLVMEPATTEAAFHADRRR